MELKKNDSDKIAFFWNYLKIFAYLLRGLEFEYVFAVWIAQHGDVTPELIHLGDVWIHHDI